jgi:hypothetical protein
MTRPRGSSAASEESTGTARDQVFPQCSIVLTDEAERGTNRPFFQELGSMYDYLAKIILLGPSGTGK